MKEKIESMKAPAAIGPYSQAVNNGGLVFVSGQLPIDCETGEFVSDDVSDQTRQSLENIKSILAEVGYDMDRILKTTALSGIKIVHHDLSLIAHLRKSRTYYNRSDQPFSGQINPLREDPAHDTKGTHISFR